MHIYILNAFGTDRWKEWEVKRMQVSGDAKFVTYCKSNGIHNAEIASKFQSEAAAIYAAKLKAVATGEPYEPPAPEHWPKPRPDASRGMGTTGMGGMKTH